MSDLSQIELNSTTYNLKDATARKYMVYYATGTGTTGSVSYDYQYYITLYTSAAFTATASSITEYYDGLTIAYKLPVDVGEFGAKLRINNLAYKPVMHSHSGYAATDIPNYKGNSVVLLVYCSSLTGIYYDNSASPTQVTGSWVLVNDYYVDNYSAYIRAGGSSGTANAATTSGNTHLILVENNARRSAVKLVPGSNMTITSDAIGNVTFTATNYWQYNSTTDTIDLIFPSAT